MAPAVDDATVRGMEEGGDTVALGYPLIVGDGRQAPARCPRRSEPRTAAAVRNSSPPGDCCNNCAIFFLTFIMTGAFIALTQVILMAVLQSAPNPVIVVIATPVVVMVFSAAIVAMCFFCSN